MEFLSLASLAGCAALAFVVSTIVTVATSKPATVQARLDRRTA
jgi:hypothetical protein